MVTKTLVKFVLSFQNFGEKIACAVRHNHIALTVEYGCVSLRMRFFSQNFGTIKQIFPGSLSPSHHEGPGTEVECKVQTISSEIENSVSTFDQCFHSKDLKFLCLWLKLRSILTLNNKVIKRRQWSENCVLAF